MTDQITATVTAHSVMLNITNAPEVRNKYGSGTIQPTKIHIAYRNDPSLRSRVVAYVEGNWRREDGELTDQNLGYHFSRTDSWPDWLARLVSQHDPQDPS